MKLYITEKPGAAREIAALLGGAVNRNPFSIQTKSGDLVVPLRGHALELVPPGDYSDALKRWDLANYPFFPSKWKWKVRYGDDYPKRLAAVKEALPNASVVIHAGDPDREGQRIVDEVLEYLGYNGPVKRILPNSMEKASLSAALKDERDNAQFRGLSMAALGRQLADWLVGMNISPTVSKALAGGETNSIGRIQTVVLGMIVRRDLEIENFVPKPFYEIEAEVETAQGNVILRYAPKAEDRRITDQARAKEIAKALKGHAGPIKVENVSGVKRPPPFYARLDFQGDAKRRLGWPTKQAGEALQTLYDEKLTTYPRGESVHLEVKQKGLVGPLLDLMSKAMSTDPLRAAVALAQKGPVVRDTRYNDEKASPHHAIIITRTPPDATLGRLGPELAKGYLLVASRYLMGHMPDAQVNRTTITMQTPEIPLGAKGEAITDAGWLVVQDALDKQFPKKRGKAGANKVAPLPNLSNGITGKIVKVKVVTKKTTPPERYTDLSLQEDMKAVAKYVDNAKYANLLKETEGIGTPATRDAVAPTLEERGYIVIAGSKDTITSTEYGRSLIAAIPATLKHAGITGLWEERMRAIEKDPSQFDEFMTRTREYVTRQVADVKNLAGRVRITGDRGKYRDKGPKTRGKRPPTPRKRAGAGR